ncbi:MAG: hypothetical protein ACREFE_15950 [Limisphaerales bacterium]
MMAIANCAWQEWTNARGAIENYEAGRKCRMSAEKYDSTKMSP